MNEYSFKITLVLILLLQQPFKKVHISKCYKLNKKLLEDVN